MSDRPQPGVPFGFGQFDLSEVMRLLQSEGPLNYEVARQIAGWVAAQGPGGPEAEAGPAPENDPDLADHADHDGLDELDELVRLARIQVQEATGLGASLELRSQVLDRTTWAHETLEDLRPILTTLAERLADVSTADGGGPGDLAGGEPADLMALMNAMAPLLLGMQAGFMIGHLATLALARYEMPLPLAGPPRVAIVGANLDRFRRDWDLPRDELHLYVAIHEAVHAALHSVAWVRELVLEQAQAFVAAFEVDPSVVEDRLGALNPMDPSSLEHAMGDPAELLGGLRSPAQVTAQSTLATTTALLEGFADAVLSEIGRPLIPAFDRIREASHRHRVERGDAAKFLEVLLGFDVGRDAYERAAAFWAGVVEREGVDGLRLMWPDARRLPTPSELDAPGLWLERIRLPEAADG